MSAPLRSINCFWRCSFSGFSSSFFSIALLTLSLISDAANFVKVTTSNLFISIGFFSSKISSIILSISTAVFPEPAAADTSKLVFLLSITCFCSLVHFTSLTISHLFSLYFLIPFFQILHSVCLLLLNS